MDERRLMTREDHYRNAVKCGGMYLKVRDREMLVPRIVSGSRPFWTSGHPLHGGSCVLSDEECRCVIPWYVEMTEKTNTGGK